MRAITYRRHAAVDINVLIGGRKAEEKSHVIYSGLLNDINGIERRPRQRTISTGSTEVDMCR